MSIGSFALGFVAAIVFAFFVANLAFTAYLFKKQSQREEAKKMIGYGGAGAILATYVGAIASAIFAEKFNVNIQPPNFSVVVPNFVEETATASPDATVTKEGELKTLKLTNLGDATEPTK